MSPDTPLSLLHLVNARSANVGNGALTEGLEGVLREDLARPLSFERLAWDDYSFGVKPFDQAFVDAINRSDGLVVGGAVAMNARPHYANTGMRFDLPLVLWPAIRKPVVFYGLSHRHWPGQTYHHADKLAAALQAILAHPKMLLALRNDGTREWLDATLGIRSDRFRIVPDPGVFVEAEAGRIDHEMDPDRPNFILAFNDEDWEGRYRTPERRMAVVEKLARAIERIVKRWNANIVIVPHYFDDFRMAVDFIDRCRPQLAHQGMIATGLAGLRGTKAFYGRYLQADLVISMRVHSMSPAFGLGVPMVPVVTQDRMSMFLADVGVADLAVDAFADDMETRLVAMVDRVMADPGEIRRRFAAARALLRDRARLFNRDVARLLANG
jgi:polysaccharide pyruvyl transferase WcaK-like protein